MSNAPPSAAKIEQNASSASSDPIRPKKTANGLRAHNSPERIATLRPKSTSPSAYIAIDEPMSGSAADSLPPMKALFATWVFSRFSQK